MIIKSQYMLQEVQVVHQMDQILYYKKIKINQPKNKAVSQVFQGCRILLVSPTQIGLLKSKMLYSWMILSD